MKAVKESNRQIIRDLAVEDNTTAQVLFGDLNKNLQIVEQATGVAIHARGNVLSISGPGHAVNLAVSVLQQLAGLIARGYPIFSQDIAFGLHILASSPEARLEDIFLDKVYITSHNRLISPKSVNQKAYIQAIRDNDIVFGIGPAGTGKTYLAVAMGIAALMNQEVQSIVLTRPAVEAGEKLGFLPGDMAQKVDPYLRPLMDAIDDILGRERAQEMIGLGIIEIAPLAFMRGRTLNNGFIILDEAQNTTREQMKMFLTRIGFDSRAVVTGDITQIDLPGRSPSGLIEAERLLSGIKGIGFCHFPSADVVRHPLVQKIIQVYARESGAGRQAQSQER